MKKFLLLISLLFLAFISYKFGYEAKLFGTDYFITGLKNDWQLGFLFVGMICWIVVSVYYSIKENSDFIKESFFKKHWNKILVFSVFLISGVNVNSGFENNQPRVYNVKLFGAIADGVETNDGAITSTSQTLTCTTCGFTSAAVGKYIIVAGAGTTGAPLVTTISAFTNSTTVTLTAAAGTTVTSGGNVIWGTENTAAIQAAINAQFNAGVGKVWLPYGSVGGMYIVGAALTANTPLGYAVNAQLYIPSNSVFGANSTQRTAVTLEGEAVGPQYPNPGPFVTGRFATTGIILRSTIAGSGILPSVIGSPNVTDGFEGVGGTDGYYRNIWIKVYTNQGTLAPTVSGLNGNFAGSTSIYNMAATIDVIPQISQDPSAREVAGFIVGRKNDNGPNIIDKCAASGFKYGFVLGEHTQVLSLFSSCNYYGVCLPKADYGVRGYVILHWNRIEIYAPSTSNTTLLDGQTAGGQCNVTLEAEVETLDTLAATRWYGGRTQPRLVDTSNNLHGNIRVTPEIGGGAKDVPMIIVNAANLVINYMQDNSNWVGGKSLLSFTPLGLRSYYANGYANLGIGSLRIQGIALNSGLIGDNLYLAPGGSSFLYDSTGFGGFLQFSNGTMVYRSAVSGTAGGTASVRNSFSINNDLSFGIGGNGTFGVAGAYSLNGSTTGQITPGATVTQDFGSASFVWKDIYYSHLVGGSTIGVSSGLGTNVSSLTPSGTDGDFSLTVVTSGNVTGTVGLVAFGRTWGATPKCTISVANATTGTAVTAGYFGINATSASSLTMVGGLTGAGTFVFNCHCGQ